MIYVFLDDGTLEIIENINVARTNHEGIDVENDVYSFFNEKGIYLKPKFTTPNIINKHLFGLFSSIQSGIYELIEAPNECKVSFEKQLEKNPILSENKWFKSIDEIKNQKTHNKCIKTIRLSLIGTFKSGAPHALLKAPLCKSL